MTEAKVQQPDADMPPPESDSSCPGKDTGRAASCSEDKDQFDDASLEETIESVKNALTHKQHEFFALTDVVAAETALVKKSFIVTTMSMLAAFTFACCCWLVVNIALGAALLKLGLGVFGISGVILLMNAVLVAFSLKVAKDAYRHVTLMPMFEALVGHAGLKREEEGER